MSFQFSGSFQQPYGEVFRYNLKFIQFFSHARISAGMILDIGFLRYPAIIVTSFEVWMKEKHKSVVKNRLHLPRDDITKIYIELNFTTPLSVFVDIRKAQQIITSSLAHYYSSTKIILLFFVNFNDLQHQQTNQEAKELQKSIHLSLKYNRVFLDHFGLTWPWSFLGNVRAKKTA